MARNRKLERRRHRKARAAPRRNKEDQLLQLAELVVHLEDGRWIVPTSNYILACAELEPRPLPAPYVRISADPELWGERVPADYPATRVCDLNRSPAPLLQIWKAASTCLTAEDEPCTDLLCCCNPAHRSAVTRELRATMTTLESAGDDDVAWMRALFGLPAHSP